MSVFLKLLHSTASQDVTAVEAYQRQGMTIAGGIERGLKDRGLAADE